MGEVKQPTIRFKTSPKRKQTSWTCTCGEHRTGFKFPGAARLTAQAHSDWHWDRGEHSTIELGGLL